MVQSITHSVAVCVVILVQCLKAVNYFFHHLTGCFLIRLYLFILISWYNASFLNTIINWFKGRYTSFLIDIHLILLFHFLFLFWILLISREFGKPSHPEELIKININQVYVASTLSFALSSITQWVEERELRYFYIAFFIGFLIYVIITFK